LAADEALRSVEVNGYTPRMRIGIHTGRPRRLGADLLGVDVNIAARVMEQATDGGLVISDASLSRIAKDHLAELGVSAEYLRGEVIPGTGKSSAGDDDVPAHHVGAITAKPCRRRAH
jgi:class 3 adenylate cyclase